MITRTSLFLAVLVGLIIPVSVFAYTSPGKPVGFVNDFANILSVQERQTLESKLLTLQNQTSFQVAVVTVKSLDNDTIENYATQLFDEWNIGQKGKDTGLLILIAPNEREIKIETGYGAEGAVTDIQAGNIIRNIITPRFREGKYADGISAGIDALALIIIDSPEAIKYSVPNSSNGSGIKSNVNPFALFFIVIFILNALARLLGKTKSWWLGGVLGGIVGAVIGLIWGFVYAGIGAIVILSILGLIFDFIVSKRPPGSGTGRGGFWPIFLGGGRGGFGGSSGGGFGGFGGGMSGGGGASGRW